VVNQNQLNMIKSTVEMRIGVGGVLWITTTIFKR
jgi:hypothetical protein